VDASWQDRISAWQTARDMWLEYPIFGVGPGQFAYNQAPFFPASSAARFRGARVNSPALEVLSEGGAVAAAAVMVIFVCGAASVRGMAGDELSRAVKRIGWAACAVMVVLWLGYYTSRYTFLWAFAGLIVASGTALASAPPGENRARCAS
jgi:O-antigen ligase